MFAKHTNKQFLEFVARIVDDFSSAIWIDWTVEIENILQKKLLVSGGQTSLTVFSTL